MGFNKGTRIVTLAAAVNSSADSTTVSGSSSSDEALRMPDRVLSFAVNTDGGLCYREFLDCVY